MSAIPQTPSPLGDLIIEQMAEAVIVEREKAARATPP